MTLRHGFFVVIEGPSGVGKTTVTGLLHTELAQWGLPVATTREPSDSALGKLARHGTDDYRGVVLACLVTADRYHHLEHDIRPAIHAGWVVICDRYVPTSLVLQHIDGVEPAFLAQLNQYADQPDLTVILTGHPEQEATRVQDRGIQSRFHQGGSGSRVVEDRLYRDLAYRLSTAGQPVLHLEVKDQTPEAITAMIRDTVLDLLRTRSS